MENEELLIRKFINSLFNDDYAPSQSAEFVAYFIRRICRGIVSHQKDVSDSSYNSLFWDKDVRNVIREEADKRVVFILKEEFRAGLSGPALLETLTYTTCSFVSHVYDNFFVCSYLKGMMLDIYEKLQGNNELHFRVKGVLWDVIEDTHTITKQIYQKHLQ